MTFMKKKYSGEKIILRNIENEPQNQLDKMKRLLIIYSWKHIKLEVKKTLHILIIQ